MREIKFRAWSPEYGRWEYYVIGQTFSDRLAAYNAHCINGEKFYQFTGKKDKNGKEIYEGDIYQSPHAKWPGEIVWTTEDWIGFGMKNGSRVRMFSKLRLGEVVGNVYENPELLKAV